MKGLFAFILLGALLVIAAADLDSEFEAFKIKFDRHYKGREEETFRKNLFAKTLKEVTEHNEKYARGEITWEAGINQFADRTEEEKRRVLGLRHKKN